ncbi:MAG: iron uptake porin [Vampirovibrionales bacterium]
MTLFRLTPALLAATVAVSGVAGLMLGAVTPASAITSVDELTDVNSNHWAYSALQDLVEKYDVIEGYPDLTFKGNRQPTRWEMAAALNALVKTIGRDLARLGAEKADKRDLQTVARLQEEFRNELNALNARTKALEDRAAAIEAKNAEQDSRLSLLEKTQIHGDLSLGGFADMSGGQSGITDGLSAVGRLRLALDIPVKAEEEGSKIGRGDVYARLIAAWGRNGASGGFGSNEGPFGPYGGYSRIAADADGGADGGTNIRSNVYLESAYYKQNFKGGIPVLTDWGITPDKEGWETTGDMYVGIVPWRFLFDKSPYRGNELTQFQNVSLVNTPGVPVNLNQAGIGYVWHQGLGEHANVDLSAFIGSFNTGDVYDGANLTYEVRYNHSWWNTGSIYLGGYHAWFGGNTLGQSDGNTTNRVGLAGGNTMDGSRMDGFYGGINQEIYKGIGWFANASMTNSAGGNFHLTSNNQILGNNNANVIAPRYAMSTGFQVPVSLISDSRANDTIGLGYAMVGFHNNSEETLSKGNEHVFESYYKYQFTDAISVVPSVQFIFNRYGLENAGMTTVLGLRTNFLF